MGCIVCPKLFLLVYVTWDGDLTSRDNYIMMSKQPPSWIRHLGKFSKFFQNTRKPPEITEKVLKINKTVKIIALKLPVIFINRNTKITNLGKHSCQNDIAMVMPCS